MKSICLKRTLYWLKNFTLKYIYIKKAGFKGKAKQVAIF